MSAPNLRSLGQLLAARLMMALAALAKVLMAGARDLPVLVGISAKQYLEPQENVLLKAGKILVDSVRIFRHECDIVMEVPAGDYKTLLPLCTSTEVHSYAKAKLANVFVIECAGKQIPIPDWFCQSLLRYEPLYDALPRIEIYALRPVFDRDFRLCGNGWHPQSGIMVHGPDIEPWLEACQYEASHPTDRLPPYLQRLLRGFCFIEPADVANAVAMLLTGMLSNHFEQAQKAMCIVDGNQPGLGKTLLVQIIGIVLDGREPSRIPYTPNDEELQKHIGATMRHRRQSVLLFDNAKSRKGTELSSPTIESNATAPRVSFRILGYSQIFERENDILWFLTMNNTRACQDLISRSCFIRLAYEGKPEDRTFELKDVLEFATDHRLSILGELAGMIIQWNQQGRPLGRQHHRQHQWAEIIGGILESAGFPEFLANADSAAACFSNEIDLLGALAELVIIRTSPGCTREQLRGYLVTPGYPPRDWIVYFDQLQFFGDQQEGLSERAKSIRIGNYLGSMVGRQLPIEVMGLSGRAVLHRRQERSRTNLYYFELSWDSATANNSTGDSVVTTADTVGTQPGASSESLHQQGQDQEGGNAENWS